MTNITRNLFLRINGRGNAWPVPVGQQHPFYHRSGTPDYANASFSLVIRDEEEHVLTDILIDAGHGIIPFLLSHGNRIPEAMAITHPHFDHILGMDWIIQSYYRFSGKKKYPVYATRGCRDQILQTLPHLASLVAFHDLRYGEPVPVAEAAGLSLTAFPVYHGPHARGASMLLFDWKPAEKRILFTGDLLFPLLHKTDTIMLAGTDWLITDANNRFPYPESNHWSVIRREPEDHRYFLPWLEKLTPDQLLIPHQYQGYQEYEYLMQCFSDFPIPEGLFHTVIDMVRELSPLNVIPVHYSGLEDLQYYKYPLLTDREMKLWAEEEFSDCHVSVSVPGSGSVISLGMSGM